MRFILVFWGLLCSVLAWAQEVDSLYTTKKIGTAKDSTTLHFTPINPNYFKITDLQGTPIDAQLYRINFKNNTLQWTPNQPRPDSVQVWFRPYPDFLTKHYTPYNPDRVIETAKGKLVRINRPLQGFAPLSGLTTQGNLVRGIRLGSNQNTSTISNLDLQITGNLSDKVSIRASIQDANIPLQSGGYSQKLDQFDQLFVELYSKNWSIKGGDLFLENTANPMLLYNKKVQGVTGFVQWNKAETKETASAAAGIVRGYYAKSTFVGQEGNQGPYKLKGNNGELYVVIISGSERVYVNGILRKRGENQDYTIDYNAGEIRFTSLFPITSEMRIAIEYQYSDRNFNRYLATTGFLHEGNSWKIGSNVYTESDIKTQPLQQNLSANQLEVLRLAGNDPALMFAPSAYEQAYSENRILYKKTTVGGVIYYEYSNNPQDQLYAVSFTFFGPNQGNYILQNANAVGKIYQYTPPLNGVPQGSYEPVVKLVAPNQLQVATLNGGYQPSEKTNLQADLAVSNYDQNLYSSKDDQANVGMAGKFKGQQRLYSRKWSLDAVASGQWIQSQFKTVERLVNIEFNRDWNITGTEGTQSLWSGGLELKHPEKGTWNYRMEHLEMGNTFSGTRHNIRGLLTHEKWNWTQQSSLLNSQGTNNTAQFIRNQSSVRHSFGKNWAGGSFRAENNQQTDRTTQLLTGLSQRFNEWGAQLGRGDSTKVFAQLGFLLRTNDSVQNGHLNRVNTSRSYFIKSQLIQSPQTQLGAFINYRELQFTDPSKSNLPSLNARVIYNDQYLKGFFLSTITYETLSGSLPQQEFTFVKVNPGQGVYMWNDYNGNGIQELQEFEVAPYPDLALYIKVFLPNQTYIKTHQNKWAQTLSINPTNWQQKGGVQQWLSQWYNQLAWQADRKVKRTQESFDLNPFAAGELDVLGMNWSFRNSLFYRRGLQRHSVVYTYTYNELKNWLVTGSQFSKSLGHQANYFHLIDKTWLVNVQSKWQNTLLMSENYASRNYQIVTQAIGPTLPYLLHLNTSFAVFYDWQYKKNQLGENERLQQQRIGTTINHAVPGQWSLNGEWAYYRNAFTGNANAPAAFQMLEALQPGENQTWKLYVQKSLTKFLDFNLTYQGRKSENVPVVHTGSVQLRATF